MWNVGPYRTIANRDIKFVLATFYQMSTTVLQVKDIQERNKTPRQTHIYTIIHILKRTTLTKYPKLSSHVKTLVKRAEVALDFENVFFLSSFVALIRRELKGKQQECGQEERFTNDMATWLVQR